MGQPVLLRFGSAERTETGFELVDTAANVKRLLLAGVERVALVAHVQAQRSGQGGTGLDDIAAAAGSVNGFVNWMDISFHRYFLGLTRRHPTLLLNTARK